MSNDITRSRIPSSVNEQIHRVRRQYRSALLSVGKSPDYHIFDLSTEFLENLKDSKAKRFLMNLKVYFAGLDCKSQEIFVLDILEMGRHYPFWYLDTYTRRNYEEKLRSVIAEVPECLKR